MSATVAIMQPYFFPYGGYYKLLSRSDLFVIYDCVQFPRRGWVHRNRLTDAAGIDQWLTLPLLKAPQSVAIKDLRFPADARAQMAERLRPFPLAARDLSWRDEVIGRVLAMEEDVTGYLAATLRFVSEHLGVGWNVVRSSSLDVPETFRGQDRIVEIARRLGARTYVNAPGGRDLYDEEHFAASGLDLLFLEPYAGPTVSMLQRIVDEEPEAIARSIA